MLLTFGGGGGGWCLGSNPYFRHAGTHVPLYWFHSPRLKLTITGAWNLVMVAHLGCVFETLVHLYSTFGAINELNNRIFEYYILL